jgi:hypothetical protein
MIEPVLDKILLGDDQIAILGAAVAGVLDLQTVEKAPAG